MYPAKNNLKPKGIIFFNHGFNDHTSNKAHIAKKFSDAGFDVVGFDTKGYG